MSRGPAQVTLPNSLTVYARGLRAQLPSDPLPDFGLYLLGHPLDKPPLKFRIFGLKPFRPTWDHERIDWPDYGVPNDHDAAVRTLMNAYERVERGQRVEVACFGGIGRTGTAIGCLAVLAGEHPGEPVEWARENYHSRAVEAASQAAWIERFAESVRASR